MTYSRLYLIDSILTIDVLEYHEGLYLLSFDFDEITVNDTLKQVSFLCKIYVVNSDTIL